MVAMLTGGLIVACQATTPSPTTSHQTPAPSTSVPSEDCRTIQHEMGETEICGQPQKIVVLGPYLLEQVLALGAQPAGFGDHIAFHQGNYDHPDQQIPYLGDRVTTQPVNVGLAYQPSIEAILSVQPDLILSPDYNTAQYETLSQIAPTLFLDVVDGSASLAIIGQALNRTEQAETLLAEAKEQIENAKTSFASIVEQHPDLLMLSSEGAQTFSLISHTNSFCGALVHDLGFQLVYPKGIDESTLSTPASVSLEALPQLNAADSIILLGFNWDTTHLETTTTFGAHQLNRLKQAWEENAIAQSLDASKAGRVYFIPAYLCLGLPGPIGTELYLEALQTQFRRAQQP